MGILKSLEGENSKKEIAVNLIDKINGADYDELLEILASDDDGEMSIAEIQDITGWDKNDVIKKLKRLIYIKAVKGRLHMGKQKIFFNSVDTTPYRGQRRVYGMGGFMKSYMSLFVDVGRGGKNKKVTTVVKCPKCGAIKQVVRGNVIKCDYCDTPMETKSNP